MSTSLCSSPLRSEAKSTDQFSVLGGLISERTLKEPLRPRLLRNKRGGEFEMFVTPSGVTAVIDTSISREELDAVAKSLKRKIARNARSRAKGPVRK